MPARRASRARSAAPRRRSPVPPPGGPMGRKGYDRRAARREARNAIDDGLERPRRDADESGNSKIQ